MKSERMMFRNCTSLHFVTYKRKDAGIKKQKLPKLLILTISYVFLTSFFCIFIKTALFPNKIKGHLNRIQFWLCPHQVSRCSVQIVSVTMKRKRSH